jgi:hypothetical protein
MAPARPVGWAFSPLDEQLELGSGGLTPRGEETLVRLAAWMPFEPARELLQDLVGMRVSKATARRVTLATGEAALAVWEAEVERLKREMPQAPVEAEKQVMSADGAFVPLVGGEWAEVKTLVIGTVTRDQHGDICTQDLSSFSRLCDVEHFEEAALVETHRRGLERSTEVCAVQDGAEWLPGFVDYHRADAVRILDFAHAAGAVSLVGEAVRVAGGRLPAGWLVGVLRRLKHQGPTRVLTHLAWLAARYPSPAALEKVTYVQKREAQMQYPTYQAAGWPIGSGSVESANKVIVEARLKGAGMHWRRENVNPLLVLRNAVGNRQWTQIWTTAQAHRHGLRTTRRHQDSQHHLDLAFWTCVCWGARLQRLSHTSVHAAISTTAARSPEQPTRRSRSAYSWHQPFLRRPPFTPTGSAEQCAKK